MLRLFPRPTRPSQRLEARMVGTTVTTTDGKTTFIVQSCEFCNLDTGGSHESDCPYYEVDTEEKEE